MVTHGYFHGGWWYFSSQLGPHSRRRSASTKTSQNHFCLWWKTICCQLTIQFQRSCFILEMHKYYETWDTVDLWHCVRLTRSYKLFCTFYYSARPLATELWRCVFTLWCSEPSRQTCWGSPFFISCHVSLWLVQLFQCGETSDVIGREHIYQSPHPPIYSVHFIRYTCTTWSNPIQLSGLKSTFAYEAYNVEGVFWHFHRGAHFVLKTICRWQNW